MENKTKIFDFEIGEHSYSVEFTRDAMKTADNLNVGGDIGAIQRTKIILYAGLLKNHPHTTMKRVENILDEAFDAGFSLDDFSEIVDEFTYQYKLLFSESASAGAKKRVLVSRRGVEPKK